MSIKMNQLSTETQIKFKMAVADGKISAEEWKQFSEEEQNQLRDGLGGNVPTEGNDLTVKFSTTQNTIPVSIENTKEEESHWFSDWLNDKDKVCTDGNDDGSISFSEAAKSFGKGLMGIVKGAINHPIATAATLGVGVLASIATGGAAIPVMIALGAGTGVLMIGKGVYDAANAETDGEAKAAWEGIGNGTFAIAASAFGAKSSLKAASKAGVSGAQGAENMNIAQATVRNFKVLPEALKVSGQNVKGNVLTWTTGNIHAHSNKLQGAETYMSKANDVQAYRFNPNGTPEEILANNPGVFRGDDGKYYLPNKLSPNEPYLIDTSKEQMIMMYGGGNMEVCDGAIFRSSYVDTESFHSSQSLNYQNPSKLTYGEVINVTEQAPGAFKVMPRGTKIQTLEGVRTVGKGEVVAFDHAGNPYTTTPANILKSNTSLSDNAMETLFEIDPKAVIKHNLNWAKNKKFHPINRDMSWFDTLCEAIGKEQKPAYFEKMLEGIPSQARSNAQALLEKSTYIDGNGEIKYCTDLTKALGGSPDYNLDSKNRFFIQLLESKGAKVKVGQFRVHNPRTCDIIEIETLIVNGKECKIAEFQDYAISLLTE